MLQHLWRVSTDLFVEGKHRFDVFLDGNLVADNLDVFKAAGNEGNKDYLLLMEDVVVDNGSLTIDLIKVTGKAKLSAIEIRPISTSTITPECQSVKIDFSTSGSSVKLQGGAYVQSKWEEAYGLTPYRESFGKRTATRYNRTSLVVLVHFLSDVKLLHLIRRFFKKSIKVSLLFLGQGQCKQRVEVWKLTIHLVHCISGICIGESTVCQQKQMVQEHSFHVGISLENGDAQFLSVIITINSLFSMRHLSAWYCGRLILCHWRHRIDAFLNRRSRWLLYSIIFSSRLLDLA